MTKPQKQSAHNRIVLFVLLGLIDLGLLVATLLRGTDVTLFSPKGLIAGEQMRLMLFSGGLLLLIGLPSLMLLYFFAWKYRETNEKASYEPNARRGKYFVFTIWAIPSVFMIILSSVMWVTTHKIEPQKPIASTTKQLTIQVIAMRWKWLFIYPEQNIATVNFIQLPTRTPVQFQLTADDAPMSSFWIPHLGGQLYAMTGHVNTLNLMAGTLGDYTGRSAEINGPGFADMQFKAHVGTQAEFDEWVRDVGQSRDALDSASYADLLKPSEKNQYAYYSSLEANLYSSVLAKYGGSHNHTTEAAQE
jgi:cytochrome o ubiquinol oxidase subunit 2